MTFRSTVFTAILLLMLAFGGYLYFQGGLLKKNEPVSAPVKTDDGAQINFVHPVFGYTLKLPYFWKGKYEVKEFPTSTQFWFRGGNADRDLLFSIGYGSVDLFDGGEVRRLIESGERSFSMIIPDRSTVALSLENAKMRRDVYEVADSFVLSQNDRVEAIKERLAASYTGLGSSTIVFSALETIATTENASSSVYYVWKTVRPFAWGNGGRLRDWPAATGPVRAVFAKNGSEIISFYEPRAGAGKAEWQKNFPASVRESAIFKPASAEHTALADKLAAQIRDGLTNYFGEEPLLSRAGTVVALTGTETPVLKIKLADAVKPVAGSTSDRYSIARPGKEVIALPLAAAISPVILPAGSTTVSVAVNDLFGTSSTSTWRTKPFWIDMKGGEILRLDLM